MTENLLYKVLAFSLGILFLGCASNKYAYAPDVIVTTSVGNPIPTINRFIGKHEDELLLKYGKPTEIIKLSDERDAWSYVVHNGYSTTHNEKRRGVAFRIGYFVTGRAKGQSQAISKALVCRKNFLIKNHIIEQVEESGEGCLD